MPTGKFLPDQVEVYIGENHWVITIGILTIDFCVFFDATYTLSRLDHLTFERLCSRLVQLITGRIAFLGRARVSFARGDLELAKQR